MELGDLGDHHEPGRLTVGLDPAEPRQHRSAVDDLRKQRIRERCEHRSDEALLGVVGGELRVQALVRGVERHQCDRGRGRGRS